MDRDSADSFASFWEVADETIATTAGTSFCTTTSGNLEHSEVSNCSVARLLLIESSVRISGFSPLTRSTSKLTHSLSNFLGLAKEDIAWFSGIACTR
mmetsp:Transcript_22046/g.33680  ORF Transcript_22046/g.33680 Transcript_22046/m.33680 type:complete len:97 (-) Transcript_22046:572-862(-)